MPVKPRGEPGPFGFVPTSAANHTAAIRVLTSFLENGDLNVCWLYASVPLLCMHPAPLGGFFTATQYTALQRSAESEYCHSYACGDAKEILSGDQPTIAGHGLSPACVSLGRCVMRRSIDSKPPRIAFEGIICRTPEYSRFSVISTRHWL